MATKTITVGSFNIKFAYNVTATNSTKTISVTSCGYSGSLSHPYRYTLYWKNSDQSSYTRLDSGVWETDDTWFASLLSDSFAFTKGHSQTTKTVTFRVVMTATDGSGNSHDVTGSVSITVEAKPKYTFTFYANGHGSNPAVQYKWYEEPIDLPTMPDQGNYVFKCWNTKSDGSGTNYPGGLRLEPSFNQSLTLYAQWYGPNTITYNGNGASGTVTQTKKHGATVKIQANTFNRTGYTFKAWNTKADGSGTNYAVNANYSSNSNLTLYAQWTAHKYTIKFNANGGSGSMSNMAMTYGQKKALTANAFSRTGHTFMGWNTNAAGTGTSYANKAEVSNLTASDNGTVNLYAKWRDDYAKPQISSLVATRVNSSRVGDDEGEYVLVTCIFTYDNAVDIGVVNTPDIKIEYMVNNGAKAIASVDQLSISGTRVTASSLIGPIAAGGDKKIVVIATAYDTYGGGVSSANVSVLTKTLFPIFHDFELYPHGGAAFGRAPRADWLDVGNGFSAAFENNGRFDTTDAGHSFASAVQAGGNNEPGNTWNCFDSVGNNIGYTQVVNTQTGVYRTFAVKNPRSGSGGTLSLYLHSNDDGTTSASLNGSATWGASDIPNGMPAAKITSDSTNTIGNVITAGSGWTIDSVTAKRWGKLCALTISAHKNAAINYPATGDIANQVIGTLKSGYLPADYAPGMCSTYPGFAMLYTNGEVRWLTAQPRSSADTIAANTSVYLRFHYMLA